MRSNSFNKALLVSLALALGGCMANVRKDAVIETSGNKPAWVASESDSTTRDKKVYFRGVVDRQRTLEMALTKAKYAAVAQITESIRSNVSSAFGMSFETDSNEIDAPNSGQGSSLRRDIIAVSKAANLSGVIQESSYWEKVSTTVNGEDVVAYKVYAWVSIPENNLRKAQIQAAEGAISLANRVRNDQAKANLNKTLETLQKEIEE